MLEKLKISKPGIIPVAYWNELIDFVHTLRITSFSGGAYSRTAGGTALWARASGGGDAASDDHPFKVLQRPKPGSTTGEIECGVIYESSLFKSRRPNDKQAITGLLNADRTSGWFTLTSGGYIWLELTFDADGAVTAADINNSDTDTFELDALAWAADSFVEDDGDETNPVHEKSRLLIAYSTAGAGGELVITQLVSHHLLIEDCIIEGDAAKFPVEFSGGYPL